MDSIDDQKLKEILISAKELFWRYGFKRVTIEEICRVAKVSKMTFYKHFKNKMELVKYIINHITDKAMQNYYEIMNSDISFPEKVKKTIDLKLEQSKDLSNEFFNDYIRHADKEMIELFQVKRNELLEIIVNDYKQAQNKGEIRKDLKPEFMLYILNHMQEMLKDEQLENMYKNPADLIMEFINFFFYGILPRTDE